MKQQTAILFFSRTAAEEANVKFFTSKRNNGKDKVIAEHLIKHSLTIAEKTKLPVFTCFSNNQKGAYFGERLANAIENVFEKGFQKVITIGNDCPSITSKLIVNVSEQLIKNDLILGPSTDGGVYLIGLNKLAYDRKYFLDLDWLKVSLQDSWINYSSNLSIQAEWLKTHSDIDNQSDFYYFLSSSNSKLKLLLTQIIFTLDLIYFKTSIFDNTLLLIRNISHRAPPKSLFSNSKE